MPHICRAIQAERKSGTTTCALFSADERPHRTGSLKSFGFTDLPDNEWFSISKSSAQRIAQECLHLDCAYRMECMSLERAIELAEQFTASLPVGSTFRTNGDPYGIGLPDLPGPTKNPAPGVRSIGSWHPITTSTFDTGIIAEKDGRLAGILWIEDED